MFRLLIITCFLVLSACSSEGEKRRAEYLDADYLTRLELPPDLIFENAEAGQSQLVLPKPTPEAIAQYEAGLDESKLDRKKANAQSTQPILPVFEGLRIASDAGLYWLEIDKSAETLWPVLVAFWENEGVALNQVEPMLGFMQTEWVSQFQLEADQGFFSKLITMVDKDKVDRFRLRVVAGVQPSQTKIFVTHSGLEKMVDAEVSRMVSRPSESDLEVEILNRLLVFIGLSKTDASALLTEYQPFARRAKLSPTDNATVIMKGSTDFVWSHLLRAVDRLGFDVAEKNNTERELKVIIQKLSPEKIGGEKDELAETSFIMQWLSGAGKEASENVDKQFVFKLKPQADSVTIQILDLDRKPADSVLAAQVIKGLLIELR